MLDVNFCKSSEPFTITLPINNVSIKFQIDMGSGVTIMCKETFDFYFPNIELQNSTILLKTFLGEVIRQCCLCGPGAY